MTVLSAPADLASVALRPVGTEDEAFLLALYISVRAPEFAAAGWDAAQLNAFLGGQYRLQAHHYTTYYDTSRFAVVSVGGEAAGRLYVDYGGEDIRIVDISLLPPWRGRGIGAALLTTVLDEARAAGRPVSLHVADDNPALGLYERLGFRLTGERNGPYSHMLWTD